MNSLFWGLPAVGLPSKVCVNAREEGGCIDVDEKDKGDTEEGKEGAEREEAVGEMVEATGVAMLLLGRPASTNADAGTL